MMGALLETKSLCKSIREGERERVLFKDVSLSFGSCGLYVVLGKSGSGKSTLMHVLSSLEKPSSGAVLFRGEDIARISPKRQSAFRKREIGFVFQQHHLEESYTVKENVLLPLLLDGMGQKEAERKAKKALEDSSLLHLSEKKAATCSGGEKARIAFLRAIIKEPSILFADEPTGALDHKNAIALMERLKDYSKEHLVIVVSHDVPLSKKYADGLLEIKDGAILSKKRKKSFKTLADSKPKKVRKERERLFLFFRNSFRREKGRHLFSFFVSLALFLNITIFFGFLEGGSSFMREGEDRSLLYLSCSLSKSESVPLAGSRFSLSRSLRPSKEEALPLFRDCETLHLENDYSFFFPASSPYRENGYLRENASFCPIWDISLKDRAKDFLIEGERPDGDSLDYALVNEEMASLLDEPLGALLDVECETSFLYQGKKETVLFENRFCVLGVVKDFAFLGMPRVFYSYPAFEERAKTILLSNGESVYEAVDRSGESDEWNAYSYWLFFGEGDAKKVKGMAKSVIAPYQLGNVLWSSQEAFSSLWDVLEGILVPFLVVNALLSFFSLIALTRSSYIENRRFLALLDAFGMSKKGRVRLFENPLSGVLFASFLFALGLCIPLSKLLSLLLERRFGISSLVSVSYAKCLGIPFLLPLALLSLVALLLLFGCRLPLFFLSRKSLAQELKDE